MSIEFPRIYNNSLERSKVTNINNNQIQKEKRYFKFFLLNNQITSLPTPVYWGAKDVNIINRDIDTFINKPITVHITGKHPEPSTEGIVESRYNNKYDFVNDAVTYYNKFGKGKIVNIYKPDDRLLQAANTDPNVKITYEGMGETEDTDFINMLDENEKLGKPMYVSPGVYATDSFIDTNGTIVVNGFVGTHLAVVDEPAHTKPIAYVKKETCKVDGKTCYFKLLTASEVVNLNNNIVNNNHMSDQSQSITSQAVVDDVNKAGIVSDQEINHVKIDTTVQDSKGNEVSKSIKEEVKKIEKNKEGKNIEEDNGKDKTKDSKSTKESDKKESSKDSENERLTLTKQDLQDFMANYKTEILTAVEEKQNQKLEATQKLTLVNAFIPKNEQTQPDYDFYNSLPVSSEQLRKIFEDSKFNNSKDKDNKRHNNTYVASASTSSSKNVSSYSEPKSYGTSNNEIHHLYDGEYIPARFR